MDWIHKVSKDWLDARKKFITATELVSLRSTFKKMSARQRAGLEINPAFASLYGQKCEDTKVGVWSYGAAARGHIMEPYAVEEFNEIRTNHMYHWDDCLIHHAGLCFSPDSLDIPQKDNIISVPAEAVEPTKILEIKSYEMKNHMKKVFSTPGSVEERLQLAVGMMVCPSIKTGFLMFYNPDAPVPIGLKVYDRGDLAKEIEELTDIWNVWNLQAALIAKTSEGQPKPCYTEELIKGEQEESQEELWREARLFS